MRSPRPRLPRRAPAAAEEAPPPFRLLTERLHDDAPVGVVPSRVYVIELERAAGRRRDPRIPWVYVGSSARNPENRFAQHRAATSRRASSSASPCACGPTSTRTWRPSGGRSPPSRRDRAGRGSSRPAASSPTATAPPTGRRERRWEEWGADRLALVGAHVDAAVAELAESSFKALTRAAVRRAAAR